MSEDISNKMILPLGMKAPWIFFPYDKSFQCTCPGELGVDPTSPGQDEASTDAHGRDCYPSLGYSRSITKTGVVCTERNLRAVSLELSFRFLLHNTFHRSQ